MGQGGGAGVSNDWCSFICTLKNLFLIVSIVITVENIVISGCYTVHECCKINMDVKWETLWIIGVITSPMRHCMVLKDLNNLLINIAVRRFSSFGHCHRHDDPGGKSDYLDVKP